MNYQGVNISKMTGKLDGILAINTNTLTNSFCIDQHNRKNNSICNYCYSVNMLKTFRKSCVESFQHNSDYLSSEKHSDGLPIINAAFFRFSGHGELINRDHFINLTKICVKNPNTTFSLWTKRVTIINEALNGDKHLGLSKIEKPKNLILIYSNPKIDHVLKKIPDHFDKVFNNITSGAVNCSPKKGACLACLKCYKFSKSEKNNIIIEKVKTAHGKK